MKQTKIAIIIVTFDNLIVLLNTSFMIYYPKICAVAQDTCCQYALITEKKKKSKILSLILFKIWLLYLCYY